MIVGSLLLIVVAAGLLVVGLARASDPLLIGSIVVSVIAAFALFLGHRRASRDAEIEEEVNRYDIAEDEHLSAAHTQAIPVTPAPDAVRGAADRDADFDTGGDRWPASGREDVGDWPQPAGADSAEWPGPSDDRAGDPYAMAPEDATEWPRGTQDDTAGWSDSASDRTAEWSAPRDSQSDWSTEPEEKTTEWAAPRDDASTDWGGAGRTEGTDWDADWPDDVSGTPDAMVGAGSNGHQAGSQHDGLDEQGDEDPPDEPPAQHTSAADVARLATLGDDVYVVDGRPRYHLGGCVHLLQRDSEPIPVGEAVDLGFTPCSLCEPDTALLTGARGG